SASFVSFLKTGQLSGYYPLKFSIKDEILLPAVRIANGSRRYCLKTTARVENRWRGKPDIGSPASSRF
ncbi:MAG: hypothetical protein SVU94_06620, partial [Bacteroidota bacterium]|nr:hypothetical protein [Bacteroidota bacterium]